MAAITHRATRRRQTHTHTHSVSTASYSLNHSSGECQGGFEEMTVTINQWKVSPPPPSRWCRINMLMSPSLFFSPSIPRIRKTFNSSAHVGDLRLAHGKTIGGENALHLLKNLSLVNSSSARLLSFQREIGFFFIFICL